jgi:hypothetical protein
MVDETKEVVVVGMSDSLKLMAFSAFVFICMCSLFTALAIDPNTMVSILIAGSGGLGAAFIVTTYMIMRYFTEQSIVYNAMNIHLEASHSSECNCKEENN